MIVEQIRAGLEHAGRRAGTDYEIVIDRSQAIPARSNSPATETSSR
jgi:hypothetical protein